MSRIESLQWEVNALCGDKTPARRRLAKAVNRLFAELKVLNEDNFDAILPTRHVDMGAVEISWSDLMYGDDYETSASITFENPFTGYWDEMDVAKRDDEVEKLEEKISELDAQIDKLRGAAKASVEKKRDKFQELLVNIQKADHEYAELMWNTSWQPFGDDVDKEIAARIPQITWVEKLSEDGIAPGTYLTLTCIGQDNGPALMAYVILAHGVMPEQYLSYWRDLSWTSHVIGLDVLRECADKMGIRPALERRLKRDRAEAKRKRKQAEKEAAEKAKIRATPLGDDLRTFLEKQVAADPEIRLCDIRNKLIDHIVETTQMTATEAVTASLNREWHLHLSARHRFDSVKEMLDSYKPQPEEVTNGPG
jgi:hypothetical protein